MLKDIKGFPNYFVGINGNVFSTKSGNLRTLSQHRGSYNGVTGKGYCMVDLYIGKERHKKLVHRLVAEAFIDNPNSLPQVDHIDKDITNNNASNLRWISAKENLYQSYETMSSTRNYRECKLYKDGVFIKQFQSVTEACKYANETYGISSSSLDKYRKTKGFEIKPVV